MDNGVFEIAKMEDQAIEDELSQEDKDYCEDDDDHSDEDILEDSHIDYA